MSKYILILILFFPSLLSAHGCDVNSDNKCNTGDLISVIKLRNDWTPTTPNPPWIFSSSQLAWTKVLGCDTWTWAFDKQIGNNWAFSVDFAQGLTYFEVGCQDDTICMDTYSLPGSGQYRVRVGCTTNGGTDWSEYHYFLKP